MSENTEVREPIIDRMKDLGNGWHVGWWVEKGGLDEHALLIEVTPNVLSICCCEGERAQKRICFATSREKGVAIVEALAKALNPAPADRDELIAALEEIAKMGAGMAGDSYYSLGYDDGVHECAEIARAALAKAKEGA